MAGYIPSLPSLANMGMMYLLKKAIGREEPTDQEELNDDELNDDDEAERATAGRRAANAML